VRPPGTGFFSEGIRTMNNGFDHYRKRILWLVENFTAYENALHSGDPALKLLIKEMRKAGLYSPKYPATDAILTLPKFYNEVCLIKEYGYGESVRRRTVPKMRKNGHT